MAGNGQHNPPFDWYDDEYWRGLFLDVAFPPIMGGGGSQTHEPGSTQVQNDPNSIQDIQADHFQYPGSPLAQGFPAGNTLGYPNAQTSLGVPAASPLPHGNPQLTPVFQNGAYPVHSIYTRPNQTTVGPVPMHEGPLLDQDFQGETTHRQPTIHPGPNCPTGTLNSPQAQYPGVLPQLTTYQPIGDSPGPNNFRASNPFEALSNDQGGSDNTPYREQLTKLYKILGDLLHSNGPSFDHSPLNQLSIELQTALLMVNEVIDNSLGSDQSANVVDGRFRCLLCRPNEGKAFKNKGTFRRHVRDQHHPDCLYHCGICYPSDKTKFRRKDKHHEHMRNTHFGQKLTREQLAALTEHLDPPPVCALCPRGVGTWDEFFECLCRHCSISKGNRSQGDSPDNDDSDGDDDDEGYRRHGGARNGHGNGHPHFYSNGGGNSGNMGNSGQPHQFDGYPFENSGAGNGAGPFRSRDAANGKIIPSDQANSQKPAFENTATRSDRPGISQPNPILPGTKHQKESKFDDPGLWVDGFTHITRSFNTELALRPNSLSWKGHGDLGKQNREGRLVSDKQSASSPVNKKIQQEFQRLRFFEGVLYENQKQGTFLSFFHETLVILAPGRPIAWSMQDISYLRAELSSEKPPEIPGDHLFYLARGKDHSTSEANLETARRASKRRAHLKVRIRAIAGVLALRAAVSKTPAAAVGNSEVGNEIDDAVDNEVGHEANDGWELGIPFPPHASQEEEMKIVTWLIQMLVFLLGMQSKPKVSLMLADDSFGISWLT